MIRIRDMTCVLKRALLEGIFYVLQQIRKGKLPERVGPVDTAVFTAMLCIYGVGKAKDPLLAFVIPAKAGIQRYGSPIKTFGDDRFGVGLPGYRRFYEQR